MGNQTERLYGNQQQWQRVDNLNDGQGPHLVKQMGSSTLGDQYCFQLPTHRPWEGEKEIYFYRTQNFTKNIVKVFSVVCEKNQYNCNGNRDTLKVRTEHMPIRLSSIHNLTMDQSAYVIENVCNGLLEILRYHSNPVFIDDKMIGLNERGQIKVWINQNYGKNYPNQQYLQMSSHGAMVQEILNCIRKHTINNEFSENFQIFVDKKQTQTIENLLEKMNQYFRNRNRQIAKISLLRKINSKQTKIIADTLQNKISTRILRTQSMYPRTIHSHRINYSPHAQPIRRSSHSPKYAFQLLNTNQQLNITPQKKQYQTKSRSLSEHSVNNNTKFNKDIKEIIIQERVPKFIRNLENKKINKTHLSPNKHVNQAIHSLNISALETPNHNIHNSSHGNNTSYQKSNEGYFYTTPFSNIKQMQKTTNKGPIQSQNTHHFYQKINPRSPKNDSISYNIPHHYSNSTLNIQYRKDSNQSDITQNVQTNITQNTKTNITQNVQTKNIPYQSFDIKNREHKPLPNFYKKQQRPDIQITFQKQPKYIVNNQIPNNIIRRNKIISFATPFNKTSSNKTTPFIIPSNHIPKINANYPNININNTHTNSNINNTHTNSNINNTHTNSNINNTHTNGNINNIHTNSNINSNNKSNVVITLAFQQTLHHPSQIFSPVSPKEYRKANPQPNTQEILNENHKQSKMQEIHQEFNREQNHDLINQQQCIISQSESYQSSQSEKDIEQKNEGKLIGKNSVKNQKIMLFNQYSGERELTSIQAEYKKYFIDEQTGGASKTHIIDSNNRIEEDVLGQEVVTENDILNVNHVIMNESQGDHHIMDKPFKLKPSESQQKLKTNEDIINNIKVTQENFTNPFHQKKAQQKLKVPKISPIQHKFNNQIYPMTKKHGQLKIYEKTLIEKKVSNHTKKITVPFKQNRDQQSRN